MKELEELKKEFPEDAMISEACYEGSNIVFYTKNREFFLNNDKVVRELVSKLRKRIEIRPASTITSDPEKAKKSIEKIIPKEAGLSEIVFQPEFGKIILRAKKPGLIIGKNGETLNKIKKETRWMPYVERVPAIESKIVNKARELTIGNPSFRKKFLNVVGSKIRLNKSIGNEWVRVTALGGYREVGRSATLLQTEESKVLIDCGVSYGGNGIYPYLNVPEFRLQDLDAVIISHAHSDHCVFLPYLYEYGYDGPVYCTEPTRDLMILLQLDFLDVLKREGKKAPYSSQSIKKAIEHCITLNYGEVSDITKDMRLTLNNAGHILGSASIHLHIGEGLHNLVHTADFRFNRSELLDPADPHFNRVETLIIDSTYGARQEPLPPKRESNAHFISLVEETLKNKGKVIVPAFSVGRSQEAMLVLYDYLEKFNVPVYLDGMIWDATALHTAYPEYLSKYLQRKIFHQGENPFLSKYFHRVGSMKEREKVIDEDSCIIITTSGMLSGGPVLTYLERLGDDPKNKLIFTGYQAAGTLGRKIQRGWREVPLNGKKITKLQLSVDSIEGFGGHSDRNQTISYVSKLSNRPNKIICQHGDDTATFNLASALHKIFNVDTYAPQNLETVRLV